MRILQVAPYFYPYVGGQERYVKNLAKALVRSGHEVEIFASDFPKGTGIERFDGIRVRRFRVLGRLFNNPISPAIFFDLLRSCKNFDIIHAHNEHGFSSLCCSFMRSNRNPPFIVTCHGQLKFDNPMKDFIERAYSKSLAVRLLGRADAVIALSTQDRKYINSLGVPSEKIRVIPNGVDLAEYNYHRSDVWNKALEGKRVVLFVGPILRRKGPHVLIQAIPLIVEKHPDTVFVFAGTGNFKEEAQRLCRSLKVERHTFFTGYVPTDRLHNLYQRSDIFVLPSYSEGLPYTVLDAMAFSKPIVSTLLPCLEEYLSGLALLISPGDIKALAQSVIDLLDDVKMARELGARGRKLLETRLNWDAVVKKVLNVYSEVLN